MLRTFFLLLIAFPIVAKSRQNNIASTTIVTGQVMDAVTKLPIPNVTVEFVTGKRTQTNIDGKYALNAKGNFTSIGFSCVGYKPSQAVILPGKTQNVNVLLSSNDTQLEEISIKAGKRPRYKNKDNPAVALIQQVIDQKESNRMLNTDYLQYNQYERINFSAFDLSPKLLKSKMFSKYKFLLDTDMVIGDSVKTALPVYMSEKYAQIYARKNPEKIINILKAHQEVDYSSFIDIKALDIYLNRLYGNPDIYQNNLFILTHEFLSPIADHAQEFYKFFITDTINRNNEKLVEISFTPRNLGDFLFEGKLYITMDGRYAVKSDHLEINKHININFVRRMDIRQEFQQNVDGRFYLTKNNIQSDFGLEKDKGTKIFGERTIFYTNYRLQSPMPAKFYEGMENQINLDPVDSKNAAIKKYRTDTISIAQTKIYRHIDSLQSMPSFKRALWTAKFLAIGYADLGGVILGPSGSFYSFNTLEGSRFSIGGRTTSTLSQSVYMQGYAAYGIKDEKWKYYLSGMYSFNKISPWGYPVNYLKISYQYDSDIPGQNFLVDKFQSVLGSLTRGRNDLWQYNRIGIISYNRDLENHFSYSAGLKIWDLQPADQLLFKTANDTKIDHLQTTEIELTLRYAPNEKIFNGAERRHTIPSKHPIFTVQSSYGIKGVLGGTSNYLNVSSNIYKRFYLSQLGYSDITLLGGIVRGKVSFPYLSILPSNQTYLYDPNAYNNMNFLEFVTDHYIGINGTHAFEGFLLNKFPLLKHLKLREYLSFKLLYGGIREENNPARQANLFRFPVNSQGRQLTYALGNAPYTEVGIGIGNIFKLIRIDAIRRFNYLDHPGTAPYGLRFTIGTSL
ncbi:DUF5686 family protein [Pedobacter sp. UYP24]